MNKIILMFKASYDKLVENFAIDNRIQSQASIEALSRFYKASFVFTVINLIYVYLFLYTPTIPEIENGYRWMITIGIVHAIMAGIMLVCGIGLKEYIAYLNKQTSPPRWGPIVVQILFCVICNLFAVAISTIDQLVSNNTTVFAMLTIGTSMLALLRPLLAIPVYGFAYICLYYALPLTQNNVLLLNISRSHAGSGVVICFFAAYIVWRQYRKNILQKEEIQRSHADIQNKQQALEKLAVTDSLTGLLIRREFFRLANGENLRLKRFNLDVSLLMIDLDHFKHINDTYGHPAGDTVLIETARILKQHIRSTDIVARIGGEEFIILLPNTSQAGALIVADKIRLGVQNKVLPFDENEVHFTASIGVSHRSANSEQTIEGMYKNADHALYEAKKSGRNCIKIANSDSINSNSHI